MTPAEQAARRLQALADRFTGPLREAYLRAVATLTPAAVEQLAARLAAGDVDGVVAAVFAQPETIAALERLRNAYAEALVSGGTSLTRDVALVLRVQLVPRLVDPSLVTALRRWEDGAFAALKAELQAGLKARVETAITRGVGPRQAAIALKAPIAGGGLTAYDERIIGSFVQALRDGRYRDALGRALRDRRFDATLQRLLTTDGPLTEAQIQRFADGYRRKLVAWRAETFARTQALQAANDAAAVGWRQAIEASTVPYDEVRRYWIVADDERLCERCAPIPDLNPDGRTLDEPFQTPVGEALGPTLHPNCRCTVFIRRERAGVRRAPVPTGRVVPLVPVREPVRISALPPVPVPA